MERDPCLIVRKKNGEYIAYDKEKLLSGSESLSFPGLAKNLMPMHKDTFAEDGLSDDSFTLLQMFIENGEKKSRNVVEIDEEDLKKDEKRKERNRKTRENKKNKRRMEKEEVVEIETPELSKESFKKIKNVAEMNIKLKSIVKQIDELLKQL
uniref:BZIP domain-containing protein n=1 Tax=Caenorhabditis tropicalis TaxID=1561998 RepID=A0A1I7SZ95_9PELO